MDEQIRTPQWTYDTLPAAALEFAEARTTAPEIDTDSPTVFVKASAASRDGGPDDA